MTHVANDRALDPGDLAALIAGSTGTNSEFIRVDSIGRLITVLPGSEGTALTSSARTATTNSADIDNPGYRGILAFLNITVASGTGGLQLIFQAKDPISGLYTNLNTAPTARTSTGLVAYELYPGAGTSGQLQQATQQPLPKTFRISIQAGDSSSYTYSVGYVLLP